MTVSHLTVLSSLIIAHRGVVPVEENTRTLWRADPFGGEVKEGAIWGHGTADDKGKFIAILE